MASGSATAVGLKELRAAVERLPADVTTALKAVARNTATRVQQRAKSLLDSKTGGKADRIAVIAVVEEADQKQFLVTAEGAADKPKNLALWFERGTQFMEARPFMRPAGDAEEERYKQESVRAVEGVAVKLGRL